MKQEPSLNEKRIEDIIYKCQQELRIALVELLQANCNPHVIFCFSSAIDSIVTADRSSRASVAQPGGQQEGMTQTNYSQFPIELAAQPRMSYPAAGNQFSISLIGVANTYSAAKNPDGAILATILNILATSTTDELFEIYQKISSEG